MSVPDPKRLVDGFTFIERGVQSGVVPDRVGADQLAFAINCQLRRNVPFQRPAILKRSLVFPDGATQTAFEQGLWQGASPYSWGDNQRLLVASISGRTFTIDPQTLAVQDRTLADGGDDPYAMQCWFEQGEMFLFRQDGSGIPVIFDGLNFRRSDLLAGEIPTGTIMKYALGRMGVVSSDRRSFVFGNLVGDQSSGTAPYDYRDSIISFTDNNFIAEGGVFSARGQRINAMRELASIDTTLNQGPIQVFTEQGVWSVDLPFDRTQWQTFDSPLQTGSVLSAGALAQNSTVSVNNDIWYRANDGFRSFQIARRDFGSWGNVPMSLEASRILAFDQPYLLGFSSGVYFDQRLLMTCSPFIKPLRGVAHRGLVALDFSQQSSLARNKNPAYDLLWTGLNILQIFTLEINGKSRCFIFAFDPNFKIALYELTASADNALFDGAGTQRIEWSFESRAFNWGEEIPAQKRRKKLVGAAIERSQLVGTVDYTLQFRQDRNPLWQTWNSWSDCATQRCILATCTDLSPNQPQYRRPALLPAPSDIPCDPQTGLQYVYGREFQGRLSVTGPAQIDSFALVAYDQTEPRYEACVPSPVCAELTQCDTSPFTYQISV